MSYETINYDKEGRIAIIALNRPKKLNAMNAQAREDITAALDDAVADKNIRVIIFTGNEKLFCAGADINEVKQMTTAALAINFSQTFQRLFQKVENLKKPVIAAIEGFALGGGCELSLACDLRVFAESASIGVPEVDIGALPAGTGTQKFPRLIGMGRAKEILFLGRRIKADEAYNLGLANKVVPNGEALNEAKKMAEKLAEKSPTAITAMKKLVNVGTNMDLNSALIFESETFGALSTHKNFQEGVSAFLEKREAEFEDE